MNVYKNPTCFSRWSVRENINNKHVYTALNDSFYVQWHGGKTAYDLRAETMYKKINKKEDLMKECIDFENHLINPKDIQEKYKFEYFIVSEDNPFQTYLKKNCSQYKLIKKTKEYSAYKTIVVKK